MVFETSARSMSQDPFGRLGRAAASDRWQDPECSRIRFRLTGNARFSIKPQRRQPKHFRGANRSRLSIRDSESASYVWERDLSSASGFLLMRDWMAYSSNESGSMSSVSSRFRDLGDEGDWFVPGKPPVHYGMQNRLGTKAYFGVPDRKPFQIQDLAFHSSLERVGP